MTGSDDYIKLSETTVVQRDYVDCGKSSGTRRKIINRKKKRSFSGMSKTMIVLAAVLLITFTGGLYFITHNKSDEAVIIPNRGKNAGIRLPPKPEERWRYIKELENRQIGVQSPTKPNTGREVNSPQTPRQSLPATITPQPTQPARQAPPSLQPIQKSVEQNTAKESSKEKPQCWLVQCGSFKVIDQAESVHAQLAFAGIESRITAAGGWNRVLLGPYSSRAGADKILQSVRAVGVSNCITVAAGG